MKTATVRQLRNAFPTVLRLVKNGEEVAITYRKKVVATLRPPPPKKPARPTRPWSDINEQFAALRATMPMMPQTAAEMLAADRERF